MSLRENSGSSSSPRRLPTTLLSQPPCLALEDAHPTQLPHSGGHRDPPAMEGSACGASPGGSSAPLDQAPQGGSHLSFHVQVWAARSSAPTARHGGRGTDPRAHTAPVIRPSRWRGHEAVGTPSLTPASPELQRKAAGHQACTQPHTRSGQGQLTGATFAGSVAATAD